MKIYLNVVGILALAAGLLVLLLSQSAVHEILGGIGIATSCISLGFAKLIELAETHLERTAKMRDLEKIQWETVLAIMRTPAPLPPVPGQEKYLVASGAEVTGPHNRAALADLLRRQAIGAETPVLVEGGTAWSTAGQILQ